MSSIAYISDSKMIEFHRLQGNTTINFWRLSLKKFTRFHTGDLLFFIDKRYRHPQTGEKGIIGYGRATDFRNLSIKKTWDVYQEMTGYRNYVAFKDAIRTFKKDDKLPQRVQSIELNGVHFFQNPLYLSEVGFDLNHRIESFMYMEKEDRDLSADLLALVRKVGLDAWSSMQNETLSLANILRDHQEQTIRNQIASVTVKWSHSQIKQSKQMQKGLSVNTMQYRFTPDKLDLYYPLTAVREQLFLAYGIKKYLEEHIKTTLNVILVSKNDLDESSIKKLEDLGLKNAKI